MADNSDILRKMGENRENRHEREKNIEQAVDQVTAKLNEMGRAQLENLLINQFKERSLDDATISEIVKSFEVYRRN